MACLASSLSVYSCQPPPSTHLVASSCSYLEPPEPVLVRRRQFAGPPSNLTSSKNVSLNRLGRQLLSKSDKKSNRVSWHSQSPSMFGPPIHAQQKLGKRQKN